jgi:hypothetical protein
MSCFYYNLRSIAKTRKITKPYADEKQENIEEFQVIDSTSSLSVSRFSPKIVHKYYKFSIKKS